MKLVLIHLSDIHFKGKTDEAFSYAEPIAKATFPKIRDASSVLVVVTGDIASSGLTDQYDASYDFLSQITRKIEPEFGGKVHLVVAPGNHDCDFSSDETVRNIVIKKIQEDGPSIINDALISACTEVQQNFFEFRKRVSPEVLERDALWARYHFEINGYVIAIECPNVAWMSQVKEKQGTLVFPISRYEDIKSSNADLRIVAMHHPLNWHSQTTYKEFRKYIRNISHIVLSGHEHEKNSGEILDQESGHSCFIEAGALSPERDEIAPSITLIEVDFDNQKYLADIHVLRDGIFTSLEAAPWTSYRALPEKPQAGFSVSAEFRKRIEDPGANFSHPSKTELYLPDIFIFPDLQSRISDEKTFRETTSSGVLRNAPSLGRGVVIKGEDYSGRTSLLYQLFSSYFEQGLLPVYLNGSDLNPSDRELILALERAISSQYGENSKTVFLQEERAKIIFLVDDFDTIKTDKNRRKIVNFLSSRSISVIITVSNLFDFEEMFGAPHSVISEMKEYEILEFGHKLRFDLIHKWASIGDAVEQDGDDLVLQIDKVEKAVTAILGKNLVSSSPIYILTMLQTQEAGRIAGDLQATGFGEYYKMLINRALTKNGVKPNELVEYQNYCAALSWKFCTNNTRELSLVDLDEANELFSKNFYRRQLADRLNILVKSKILELRDKNYSFNYPYLYYFFLGKYIGDRVSFDPEVEKIFLYYCDHLYVKDYGNTILFAAYHNSGSRIYEAVANVLSTLFSSKSPLDLSKDTSQLVKLISRAPELSYTESDIIDNRRRANEIHDEIDRPSSAKPVTKSDQEDPHFGLASKLNLLFKTVDILGQILKNQYATITTEKKIELISASFDGPMRALRDFVDFVESNPDGLILEIERAISNKNPAIVEDERKKIATEAAFFFVTTICFSFIYKPMLSVTSEYLLQTISTVVKRSKSGSYKLIELAAAMEVNGDIPFNLISEVSQISRGNPYMEYILKCIGLNYLYRFKTNEREKQKLCSELNISMNSQRAIDIQTRDTKID